jgi:mRNA interferase RelE/StbE
VFRLNGDAVAACQVEVSPRAERDLKKLYRQSRQDYDRVRAAIRPLASDPRPPGCKPLSGSTGWRIRIGDHRVIYAIDDEERIVTILGVAHRREVYRRR